MIAAVLAGCGRVGFDAKSSGGVPGDDPELGPSDGDAGEGAAADGGDGAVAGGDDGGASPEPDYICDGIDYCACDVEPSCLAACESSSCFMACASSDCHFDCDSGDCYADCISGATCDMTCAGDDCMLACPDDGMTTCSITCPSSVCDNTMCSNPNVQCLLRCRPGGACDVFE